jgi:hypothetical protein
VFAAWNCRNLTTKLVLLGARIAAIREYLDDSARAVLAKLNPSTLVKLIESLVSALLNGNHNTHGAARRMYSDY